MVFHLLNRGVGRRDLFEQDGDVWAFERVLLQALRIRPMRVRVYCLLSNLWHIVFVRSKTGIATLVALEFIGALAGGLLAG